MFGLGSGMRVGEVTGLTWEDIDEKEDAIRLHKQLQREDGKLTRTQLKSHRTNVLVPLNDLTRTAIARARAQNELFGVGDPGDYVFLNSEGRACDPKWINKHLHRICEGAGLPRIGFHALRHTAATLMIAAGASSHDVMFQLGHTSLALVSSTYVHAVPESQRRAASLLDSLNL